MFGEVLNLQDCLCCIMHAILERNRKNLVCQNSHTVHIIECQVLEAVVSGHSLQTNQQCFPTRLISTHELRSSCVAGVPQCLQRCFVSKHTADNSEPPGVSLQSPVTISKAVLAVTYKRKKEITEQVCGFTSHIRGVRAKLRKYEQMERAETSDVS